MAEETTQATTAAPGADTAAVAAKAQAAKDKASAEKWGAVAAKSLGVDTGADTEAVEAPASGEKPRGKNGQFLPEKGKAKEKTDGKKTEAKAAPEAAAAVSKLGGKDAKEPGGNEAEGVGGKDLPGGKEGESGEATAAGVPEFSGGLGKAKRLAREGDIAGALKLIDLDLDKIPGGVWASLRKFHHEEKAKVHKRESDVIAAHQKVQSEARELVAQLRPFAEADAALKAGDEDRVFEIIFGKSVDEWQRGRLAKMHRGDLSKDPAVSDLTRRLDAERLERQKLEKRLEERDQAAAERDRKAAADAAGAKYRDDLTERMAGSGDERLAAAAEHPWFIKMVHDERLKHYRYDETTDTEDCISEEEAIEAVYDPERLTAAQWKQLTGGLDPTVERDPSTITRVATDRRVNDVKRVAKAPTSLSRSATVEAAPERRRSDKESLAHWSGIAQKLAQQGK